MKERKSDDWIQTSEAKYKEAVHEEKGKTHQQAIRPKQAFHSKDSKKPGAGGFIHEEASPGKEMFSPKQEKFSSNKKTNSQQKLTDKKDQPTDEPPVDGPFYTRSKKSSIQQKKSDRKTSLTSARQRSQTAIRWTSATFRNLEQEPDKEESTIIHDAKKSFQQVRATKDGVKRAVHGVRTTASVSKKNG